MSSSHPTTLSATTPSSKDVSADKPGFNYAINGFRGVCVLMVFVYHVANSGLMAGLMDDGVVAPSSLWTAVDYLLSSLRYGVELFFMISGYVIVQSLRRHGSIGAFLRDRVLRIFPVWIPVHLCLFTAGMATGFKIFHDLTGWERGLVFIANLFLLPPLVPVTVTHPGSWSLTYEWLFYLLAAGAFSAWSLCLRTTKMDEATAWFRRCGIWGLWAAITVLLLSIFPRGVFFIPGVIVALSETRLPHWRRYLRFPVVSLLVFLLAWRAIGLDRAEPAAYSIATVLAGMHGFYFLLAFVAGLHLFACLCVNERMAQLRTRTLQRLGTISYSFYLWHPIVMFVVKRFVIEKLAPLTGPIVTTLVFSVLSFVIATVISWYSHQWFEQRLSRWLRTHWLRDTSTSLPLPLSVSETGTAVIAKLQDR